MAKFLNKVATVQLKGDWHITQEPLRFVVAGRDYEVPAKAISDGPSIPRWLRWLITRGEIWYSGLAHDYLREHIDEPNFVVDALFYSLVLAESGSKRTAILAYIGVRIGTYTGFDGTPPKHITKMRR